MFFGSGKKEWDPSVTKSKARDAANRQSEVQDMATGRSSQATWHVLTVRAYWKETLNTGNIPCRIRELIILFYLDDGTVEVREKKKANMGLPQGVFLKRHKVSKRDGSFVTAKDLAPGSSVNMYGRQFHILGCMDDITREQLQALGIDTSIDKQAPEDPATTAANKFKPLGAAANREFKDYNETMLGGSSLAVRKLGDFLEFGAMPPLKFQAVWRDKRMYGDLNRYTVSFYLEDRTFKIFDDVHGNDGKGPFTTSLKRQKIPKLYKLDADSIGQTNSQPFYDVLDLYVGSTIQVHGRQLLIVDAVPTTRKFYADQALRNSAFQEQPKAIVLEEDRGTAVASKQEPAPYFGGLVTFGSEESSLQSCLSLHPAVPKQDAEKVKSNQSSSLKFSADLISDRPEDFGRRYIVSFFLYDETVSVFEEGRKNSGIVPGKFLKRKLLKNSKGEYFKPTDFFVGASLVINNHRFVLTDLDAFTLNYAINRPEIFAWANLERIIADIRSRTDAGIVIGNSSVASGSENETIAADDFKKYLGTFLSQPELDAISGFFYPSHGSLLTWGTFRAFLQLTEDNFDELIASDTVATVVADSNLPQDRRSTKKSITKIRHGFAHAQVSFKGITDKYKNEHGNLSREDLKKALEEAKYISNVPIKPHDIKTTVDYFFPPSKHALSVNKLNQFLFERRSVKQARDDRVTSTALHNSVPAKISTSITTNH